MDANELTLRLILLWVGTGLMVAAFTMSFFRRRQAVEDLEAVYAHPRPTAAMLILAETSVRSQTIRLIAYGLSSIIMFLPLVLEPGQWAVPRLALLLATLISFPYEERYLWRRRDELMKLLREDPEWPASTDRSEDGL